MVDACVAIARITHTNRSCSDMAIVFAIAVAVVIRLDATASEWTPASLLDQWIAMSRPFVEPATMEHMAVLSGCLDASPGEAADTLAFIGYPTVPADERARGGINGDAVSSTLWGLWCFVRHPRDMLTCVQAAVRAGGDTDSTAAFACALVGYACAGVRGGRECEYHTFPYDAICAYFHAVAFVCFFFPNSESQNDLYSL
jgi:ADP-ribosylglycohydrolase